MIRDVVAEHIGRGRNCRETRRFRSGHMPKMPYVVHYYMYAQKAAVVVNGCYDAMIRVYLLSDRKLGGTAESRDESGCVRICSVMDAVGELGLRTAPA